MTATLRPMAADDLDQVMTICAASAEAPQWSPTSWTAYLEPDPRNPALLRTATVAALSDEEAVAGFACATLLRLADSGNTGNLCQLDSIAVSADARRRGIGRALLGNLLSWAAQNGATHFSLEVRASNLAAIALYESAGLRPEGRRRAYYSDPVEDALLLGMPVTAGTW
jgi:[ribosomal protein S18]-alanine N-acetyltransferase